MPTYSDVRYITTIYNPNTLSFDLWDGSLETGELTIGSVTQSGTWNVGITGVPHVVIDSMPAGGAGLTDAELRATAVPVSGTVTANAGSGTLAVSGTFWQATQPVSGTVTANAGTNLNTSALATSAAQATLLTELQLKADLTETQPVSLASVPSHAVTGTFWQATQPISVAATLAVKELRSATGTLSNVADTATSTTLLASNANRLGATIYNDSTAALYVKFGATASATSFTVKMVADAFYEIPFGYTGIIDGIWASDASGSARITELT